MPGEMVDFLWESTSSILMAFLSVLLINCLKIEGPALFDQAVLSIRDTFKVHSQMLISDGPTWSDEETSSGAYLDLLNNFSVADFSDRAPFILVPSLTESAPVPQVNDPHQDQFDVTTYAHYTGVATVAFPNVLEAPPTSAILDAALEMLEKLSWPTIALSQIDFASILFGINFLLIVAVVAFLGQRYKRQIRTLKEEVSARKAEIAILSGKIANLTNASDDTSAMLTVLQKDVYKRADNVDESAREQEDQQSQVHNTKLELESYHSDIEEKLAASNSNIEKLTTKVEAKLDAKLEATNRSIEKLVTSFEAKLLASNSNVERLIINVEKQHDTSNSKIGKLATNVEAKLEASNSKMEKLATNVGKKLIASNSNIEKLTTDVEKKLGADNNRIEKLVTDAKEKHEAGNSKIEKLVTDVKEKHEAGNSKIEKLAADVEKNFRTSNSNIVKLAADINKKLRADHSNIQKLVTHVEKKLGASHSDMVTLGTNVAELDRRQVSYANRVDEIQGTLGNVMVDLHASVDESKESLEAAHQSSVDTVDIHCASFETWQEEVRCLRYDYEQMKKKLASPPVAAEPASSDEQSPTTSQLSIQLASPYLSIQPVATEPARSGEQPSKIPRLSIQPVVTILSIPPAATKPASNGEQSSTTETKQKDDADDNDPSGTTEKGKPSPEKPSSTTQQGKTSPENGKESGKESSKESDNVSGKSEDEPNSGKGKQRESSDEVVDQGQSRVDDDDLYGSSATSSPVRSTGAPNLPTEPEEEPERAPRPFRFLADAEYDTKSRRGRRRHNHQRRQYEESIKQTLQEKGESSNSPPAGHNPFARDFRPGEIRVDGKLLGGTGGLVLPKGPKALTQTTQAPIQTPQAPSQTTQAPSQTKQAPSQTTKPPQLASRWAPKGQD